MCLRVEGMLPDRRMPPGKESRLMKERLERVPQHDGGDQECLLDGTMRRRSNDTGRATRQQLPPQGAVKSEDSYFGPRTTLACRAPTASRATKTKRPNGDRLPCSTWSGSRGPMSSLELIVLRRPWLATLVWALIYISDYAFTLIGAYLYERRGRKYFVYEHYELTPYFQGDIGKKRIISKRAIFVLVLYSALVWFVVDLIPSQDGPDSAVFGLISFVVGMLFLAETGVHLRHFRTIGTFLVCDDALLEGHIRFKAAYSYRISAVDLCAWVGICVALFLWTGRWFFCGGALSSLMLARAHWRLSAKARAASSGSGLTNG